MNEANHLLALLAEVEQAIARQDFDTANDAVRLLRAKLSPVLIKRNVDELHRVRHQLNEFASSVREFKREASQEAASLRRGHERAGLYRHFQEQPQR